MIVAAILTGIVVRYAAVCGVGVLDAAVELGVLVVQAGCQDRAAIPEGVSGRAVAGIPSAVGAAAQKNGPGALDAADRGALRIEMDLRGGRHQDEPGAEGEVVVALKVQYVVPGGQSADVAVHEHIAGAQAGIGPHRDGNISLLVYERSA